MVQQGFGAKIFVLIKMSDAVPTDKDVVYIYSPELELQCSKNPAIINRAFMVHGLIQSYGLLNYLKIKPPKQCSSNDLRVFHTSDYIDYLKKCADYDHDDLAEDFGLGFDCPIWPEIYEFCKIVAGSTIKAADEILNGAKIVLNWFGGWHHAASNKAAGYCYTNDIVLGILTLRQKFSRILYIDLDVHHGDAVEGAFEATKRVFTLSFHQHEPGFYPGTGSKEDCGFGAARGYSMNFPYKAGISGILFRKYFTSTADFIIEKYNPEVFVIQCGADAIAGDPLGSANILPEDFGYCIQRILDLDKPTMLLGGGGYNFPNTSRYWAYLTSLVCGQHIQEDIPDHPFFLKYGPDYSIKISSKSIKDENSEEYLNGVSKIIQDTTIMYSVSPVLL